MNWVYINDSGVDEDGDSIPDHEAFVGEMSKYEVTNAQYCSFLNAALDSGDIYVSNNVVYGKSGSNSGEDFPGKKYLKAYAASRYSQIAFADGTFSVRIRDGFDMSNHPVVEVTWYGATAFCNYFGYYLPTEWQWQAVADYDGSYAYGCGTTLNQGIANYYDGAYLNPLKLTSFPYSNPVGYYPAFGYGLNDMAGNSCEWTSTVFSVSNGYMSIRGGSWGGIREECKVGYRHNRSVIEGTGSHIGFRVCR